MKELKNVEEKKKEGRSSQTKGKQITFYMKERARFSPVRFHEEVQATHRTNCLPAPMDWGNAAKHSVWSQWKESQIQNENKRRKCLKAYFCFIFGCFFVIDFLFYIEYFFLLIGKNVTLSLFNSLNTLLDLIFYLIRFICTNCSVSV